MSVRREAPGLQPKGSVTGHEFKVWACEQTRPVGLDEADAMTFLKAILMAWAQAELRFIEAAGPVPAALTCTEAPRVF